MKKKNAKLVGQLYQGDICFEPCDSIPDSAQVISDGIVARGESTGHMHRIEDLTEATLYVAAATMYIRATAEAKIKHNQHGPITLPPGNWKVTRQEEYTPAGWRQVAD